MGLFGSRCVRCNAALSPADADDRLPTCERCSALLEARLQAGSEPRLACPVDGATMVKTVVHDIVIDRCPSCGGVWLDGGELELLRKTIEEGDRTGLIRSVVLGMTRA